MVAMGLPVEGSMDWNVPELEEDCTLPPKKAWRSASFGDETEPMVVVVVLLVSLVVVLMEMGQYGALR